MGGAARNHGGTRGHGCSPLPGERPNVNRHTLIDSTIFYMVKNKKVGHEKQPTDQKLMIVKQLPRIISKVIKKKQVSQDVQSRKKVEPMRVPNKKDQGSIHQLKQTKVIKAESPAQNTTLERLDDKNLQKGNSKSLEGLNTDPCLKVTNKQCSKENNTQVVRVAKGNPKTLDGKTKKQQVEDSPLNVPKIFQQKTQQQIDDKIIPELDTKPVKQMHKELPQKLPDQHPQHDNMTLQYAVKEHHEYHAVPQPMVSLTAFQTHRPQLWVPNCPMQTQVSPTLISFPSNPVHVSSFQLPCLVQVQLSPVMFMVNTSNQAHIPPTAYMTSMPEQD